MNAMGASLPLARRFRRSAWSSRYPDTINIAA